MGKDCPGVRPAVIDRNSALALDEFTLTLQKKVSILDRVIRERGTIPCKVWADRLS